MSTNFKGPVVSEEGFTGDVTGNITGDVTGDVTGDLTGLALQGGASAAATSGVVAIPVTTLYSGYTTNDTANIAATLADGEVGQMKIIKLETKDTNNLVVTPANLNNGATLTFDATGEIAVLVFVGTGWEIVYNTATLAS
jgi:hypothetical protein